MHTYDIYISKRPNHREFIGRRTAKTLQEALMGEAVYWLASQEKTAQSEVVNVKIWEDIASINTSQFSARVVGVRAD